MKKKKNQKKSNIWSNLKKAGSSILTGIDKVAIGAEKAKANLYLGNIVTITNGMFSGKQLLITSFIVGGIEGKLNDGTIVRIRHGSYVK